MAVRKIISLPENLVRQIEDYRFGRRINTESQAIRELLTYGLAHREQSGHMRDLRRLLARVRNQMDPDDARELNWTLERLDDIEQVADDTLDETPKLRLPGFE